ncbi:MAG: hypothetical protein EPO27_02250 [Betaproteobacteria bacterium]|nr:MAG: hypothetical protein EPO27_02250 [Betaproteobacteria bacterium]
MTRTFRWLGLGLAVAVNGAALAVLHAAMLQTVAREQLALQRPSRIVVTAPPAAHALASAQSCPGPKVL